MELVALWFENYKIFGKTTLPLNPKYQCHFDIDDEDNLAIDIQKSSYYNIFPDNLNIVTIVGKNGMGKTTILNIIRSILNSNDTASNTLSFSTILPIAVDKSVIQICSYLQPLQVFKSYLIRSG